MIIMFCCWTKERLKIFYIWQVIVLLLHTCMFPAFCFHQRPYMAQYLVNCVFNEI